jgi:predicted PurR-regulated permease PerM
MSTLEAEGPWLTRDRLVAVALFMATLLVFYLCYLVTKPFVPALAWAGLLAIISYPLHRRIRRRVGKPSIAAALVVIIVAATIVLPSIFVTRQVVLEASQGVERVRSGDMARQWEELAERYPGLAPGMLWLENQVDFGEQAEKLSQYALGMAKSVLSRSFYFIAGALVALYLLFYFLRDKAQILASLRSSLPLRTDEANKVLQGVSDTSHAVVYGTLVVALLQGALGGLMFWLLGLPGPLLWGSVMALLGILPVAGAAIVWVPAAAYLALQGEWGKAMILTSWGAVVVGLIDNVVYPILVKDKLRIHTVPVFISIVGGLIVFGSAGVIIGPVVLATAVELARIWQQRLANGKGLEDTA